MNVRLAVLLLPLLPILAAPQSGELTLNGVVLNSQTGESVRRALVQITLVPTIPIRGPAAPAQPHAPLQPFTATTFTDAAGAFEFRALSAGSYFIGAEKPEFSTPPGKNSVRLEITASKGDLTLQLSPLGVITGKVVDQSGQPLRAVNVVALSTPVEDGWRQLRSQRSVSTDDRGVYRLWNLQPGKYYLKAAGRSGGTYTYAGDLTPQFFADESFVPTYFGGAQTLDAATAIEIAPGTEAHADITLKLEQAYKVRGALMNYVPRHAVKFELLRGNENVSPSRVSVNTGTGKFEIQDVLPGSYLLRATQDQNSASLPLSVPAANVDGLSLVLNPPVGITGQVRFANAPPPLPQDAPLDRAPDRAIFCMTSLHPPPGATGPQYQSQLRDSGELVLENVIPGAYRFAVECYGGYIQSAMSGTQDLLANPILNVQSGEAPPAIDILAAHGGGSIQGTITDVPAGDSIQVLAVPRLAGSIPVIGTAFRDRVGQATPASWPFDIGPLAPGTYTVYAFPPGAEIEFRNPRFIETLRGGIVVEVTDQQVSEVTIKELVP